MTKKIMLVDDHAIVREGYRALLQRQAQLTIVAEASRRHASLSPL